MGMRLLTSWGTLLLAAIASAVILMAAACGPTGNSPSAAEHSPPTRAAASPSPALSFCQDVARLHATLQALTPIKGALRTSTEMRAAAQEIQSSLSGSLGKRSEWQTEIDNLKAAAANMRSAADDLAASPGARGVTSHARTAVGRVDHATRRLLTAVGSRCPSPSPSPASS